MRSGLIASRPFFWSGTATKERLPLQSYHSHLSPSALDEYHLTVLAGGRARPLRRLRSAPATRSSPGGVRASDRMCPPPMQPYSGWRNWTTWSPPRAGGVARRRARHWRDQQTEEGKRTERPVPWGLLDC